MKLDVIIGNPPYQMNDGGGLGVSSVPLYNYFVNIANILSSKYATMIIPSRWFSGGKGLDRFRDEMLNNTSIRELYTWKDCREVFPAIEVAGGICVFLIDKSYHGLCKFINYVSKTKESTLIRQLNTHDICIGDNNAISIVEKALSNSRFTLESEVYPRNPFGINSNFVGNASPDNEDDVVVYCKNNTKYYIPKNKIRDPYLLDKYSVIITKVSGDHDNNCDKNGKYKVLPTTIQILKPGEACSETFLCIGKFETEQEALNLESYIKTKTFRFLLLQTMSSINISRERFKLIPLIDFSREWNDKDLYEKFGFTESEISYIESKIRSYGEVT